MNSREYEAALRITQLLVGHPLAVVFRDELGTIPPAPGTITRRLLDRRFASFAEWERSVQRIWASPDQSLPYKALAASGLGQLYRKIRLRVRFFADMDAWASELCRIRCRLGQLTYLHPFNGRSALFSVDRPIPPQLHSESDYRQFLLAMTKLTHPDDQESLLRLIEAEQPELRSNDPKVQLNILKLTPATFAKARDFVRDRLKAQRIEYFAL
jgi:hypothetical protein